MSKITYKECLYIDELKGVRQYIKISVPIIIIYSFEFNNKNYFKFLI